MLLQQIAIFLYVIEHTFYLFVYPYEINYGCFLSWWYFDHLNLIGVDSKFWNISKYEYCTYGNLDKYSDLCTSTHKTLKIRYFARWHHSYF